MLPTYTEECSRPRSRTKKQGGRFSVPHQRPCLLWMLNPQLPRLTGVEVLGLGELDGGSSFLLQLDNGLASFANDGAGSIAGNQDLKEVLAVLCKEGNRKGACEEALLKHQARFRFALLQPLQRRSQTRPPSRIHQHIARTRWFLQGSAHLGAFSPSPLCANYVIFC